MATRNPTLLGQYAGFVTRAAALIMDIVIIIAAVFIINAVIALPLVFFLRVDVQTCVQDPASYGGLDWTVLPWPRHHLAGGCAADCADLLHLFLHRERSDHRQVCHGRAHRARRWPPHDRQDQLPALGWLFCFPDPPGPGLFLGDGGHAPAGFPRPYGQDLCGLFLARLRQRLSFGARRRLVRAPSSPNRRTRSGVPGRSMHATTT